MPLVVAICLFAVFFVFLAASRKREYLLLCLLAFSLTEYLFFTLMYIAKKGGIGNSIRFLLFLSDGLRIRLQYATLTLQQLGYYLAIGRYIFPWLFLITALHYYSDSAEWIWLRKNLWLTVLAPIASLILYYPPVFSWVAFTPRLQHIAAGLSFGWIVLYLAAGIYLLLKEPVNLRIRYIRRASVMRFIMLASVAALYALYCPQDPAQIYLFYRDNSRSVFGLWYLNPYLSREIYMVVLGANLISLVLGVVSMMSIARMEWSENQDDIRLQYKYDAAKLGSSVFVHGIKNQLLSNRVIYRRLKEQLEQGTPDLETVRMYAGQLAENNEGLLQHVDELYKSFKSNIFSMHQCGLEEIMRETLASFLRKYQDAQVVLDIPPGLFVLADKVHLTAALTNLLTNGWEATLEARRNEPLTVICYEKRRDIGICICDHGTGIGAYDLKRMFEPFYSSKNSSSNWGLGLYYVRNIIKKHMGSISVESKPGSGTRFYILLPKLLPKRREKRGKQI